MVYHKIIKIVLLANLFATAFKSQSNVFYVKAGNEWIYFYKTGQIGDSILTKHNNQFYLLCRERQKKDILIYVENARLMAAENDSTVFVDYLPGLKYEAWFVQAEDSLGADGKLQKGKTVFTSFLNGTTPLEKNKIRIQIYLKRENELVLSNVYYYKD